MDLDIQDAFCKACHQNTLIWDADTYSLVCSACGATNDSPQLVHDSGFDTGQPFGETIAQRISPRKQYSTMVKDSNWYEQNNKVIV
jgi:transcription initiation factor TFIIIB Brf1 subunit/transcription initiation factor TFIIB